MSLSTPGNFLTREENSSVTILRVHAPRLRDGDPALAAVRDALLREVEVGSGPLILDLTDVEFLTSAALSWLVVARKKLRDRGQPFQPLSARRWMGGFAFFPDQAAALEAIRQGEPDSLLLCGVRTEVMEVFVIC